MDERAILQSNSGHLDAYRPLVTAGGALTMDPSIAYADGGESGLRVDPVAVSEILGMRYVLGDRSLVEGVRHVPWRSTPTGSSIALPAHGCEKANWPRHADALAALLKAEMRDYVAGHRRLGLLLSGGMDSRIAAGVLRTIEIEMGGGLEIVALTWGLEDARDVVYAKEVARRYGWEWGCVPLSAAQLARNITTCGLMGAEFSPLHLHGLREIGSLGGLDLLVAGSYGDSIGRGEYSGVRVERLPGLVPANNDRFAILRPGVARATRARVLDDAYGYRSGEGNANPVAYAEIERQRHYMSRMLSACMQFCCWPIPVRQAFTSPEVVAHMWRLDPRERDDRYYEYFLRRLPGGLDEIPWARTGLRFGAKKGTPDRLRRHHHAYGRWLREDLAAEVTSAVRGDEIARLGLFSSRGLERLLDLWRRGRTDSTSELDEIVSWLASVSVFVRRYGVTGPVTRYPDRQSRMRGLTSTVRGLAYCYARNIVRS